MSWLASWQKIDALNTLILPKIPFILRGCQVQIRSPWSTSQARFRFNRCILWEIENELVNTNTDSDYLSPCTPPEVVEAANAASLNLRPVKSRKKYEIEYQRFMQKNQQCILFWECTDGVCCWIGWNNKIFDLVGTLFHGKILVSPCSKTWNVKLQETNRKNLEFDPRKRSDINLIGPRWHISSEKRYR